MAASLQGCAYTVKFWLGQLGEKAASHRQRVQKYGGVLGDGKDDNAIWDHAEREGLGGIQTEMYNRQLRRKTWSSGDRGEV